VGPLGRTSQLPLRCQQASTAPSVHIKMARDISCVSLGMLIIDEIRMPGRAPLIDVIGGSATFVTLGLRLFAPKPSQVGCLVLAGEDFPPSLHREIYGWETTLVLNKAYNVPSSRGLLEYHDDTFGRAFRFCADA
jgi:hypothetical protein